MSDLEALQALPFTIQYAQTVGLISPIDPNVVHRLPFPGGCSRVVMRPISVLEAQLSIGTHTHLQTDRPQGVVKSLWEWLGLNADATKT